MPNTVQLTQNGQPVYPLTDKSLVIGALSSITSNQDGSLVFTFNDGDTITVDLNHNHPQYYSKPSTGIPASDLEDGLVTTVETTLPANGMLPNVLYILGTLSGNTTFTLASAGSNIVNHYYWTFDTGSTAPTITWPSGLSWFGGSAPTINASKHYEISVLDGIAVAMEV